ncbi:unnamed protein product [Linum trigynum]|uniref:Uncharacterized protein n=1 Tax=Linum trigynum TaxID=586398 RepID=A0AAV2GR84_9ROSI
MSAVASPLAEGDSEDPPPAETVAGQQHPPIELSSPNSKTDRESQHTKKRAKPTVMQVENNDTEDEMLKDAPNGNQCRE